MEDLFRVGVITSPHGIHGDVNVFPTTDDPTRFGKIKEVILDDHHEKIKLTIKKASLHKNMVILGFKEFKDINEVEKYRKCELFVTRENAIPLEEGEYYIADLMGLSVFSDDGRMLGTLTDVLQTGANDVYVVSKDNKELLIPAIKDCIKEISLEEKKMQVHLLPGLEE